MPFDRSSKPDPWGFESGFIDPKWDTFWNQQSPIILPLWEGAGEPRNLGSARHPIVGGDFGWTDALPRVAYDLNGSPDYLDFGDITLGANWTVCWYGEFISGTTLFAFDDFGETDISSGRDAIICKPGVGGGRVEVHVSGTGVVLDNHNFPSGPFMLHIVRSGETVWTYVNGTFAQSGIVALDKTDRVYQFGRLGCHRFSGTNSEFTVADHFLFFVLNDRLRANQIADHADDPFGPFRVSSILFNTQTPAVAVKATGIVFTVLMAGGYSHPPYGSFAGKGPDARAPQAGFTINVGRMLGR